jgi:hypothetical protein
VSAPPFASLLATLTLLRARLFQGKTPGVYQYKIDTKSFKAAAFGGSDAEGEVSAASMFELEQALVAACAEKSGFAVAEFQFTNSQVTPKTALWTACIGTAKIGGGGGGGGGGAAPAAAGGAAPAAAAKAPEPEPEEEEEDMGFDLFD